MKRLAKLIISVIYFSAATTMSMVSGRQRSRLVILYYHAVPPHSRIQFARQLDAIAACGKVVPADCADATFDGRHLIAITFDDAFMSVVDVALPELSSRGMTATIFVPSGVLGRRPQWQMESDGDRNECVASEATLSSIASSQVVFGAHSVSHPHLTEIPPEEAWREIANCKRDLEGKLRAPVELFAFPYGDFNSELVGMCRKAGYRHCYSIIPQALNPSVKDFLRGRVAVDLQDGKLEFWLKIRGAYSWMAYASNLKRRLFQTGRTIRSNRNGGERA